jgi:hypothetical protein
MGWHVRKLLLESQLLAEGHAARLPFVLLLAWSSAVASASGAAGDFVHIAEGLTSSSAKAGITAGYRMFSQPDMRSVCEAAHADQIVSFRPVSPRVKLHVHQTYALENLRVVAVAASGSILPRVPMQIDVERVSPEIVNTRSDHLQDAVIVPAITGRFRFRFRTVCGGSAAEATVVAEVVR